MGKPASIYWSDLHLIIPPASMKLKGGMLVSPCPFVRLSICLWMESCPLCIFNNTCWIHLIFIHLIKQHQKVCCELRFWQNYKIWIFGNFLDLQVSLCPFLFMIQYHSMVWVIMGGGGGGGVFSECRRSSCSSFWWSVYWQDGCYCRLLNDGLLKLALLEKKWCICRDQSRHAPSQWETSLQCIIGWVHT